MSNPTTITAIVAGKSVTADATTGEPTTKPTAKVIAGAVASAAILVVIAVLGAVTPAMLSFAGPYSPLIFAAVTALGGALASYIKSP